MIYPSRANKAKQGFTLIELLVVITIIGILATLAFSSYSGAQKQSRDTKRKSDISQYRTALETYASVNNMFFPSRTTRTEAYPATNSLCSDLLTVSAISGCPGPTDPINDSTNNYTYWYRSNGTGSGNKDATQYVLWGRTETGGFWEICANGKIGKLVTAPSVGDGDALGACQL